MTMKRIGTALALFMVLSLLLSVKSEAASADVSTKKDSSKIIALSFDDGPSGKYDGRILDILDKFSVKATFFMVGANIAREPLSALEIALRGHEIGNHTFSHKKIKSMSDEMLTEELSYTSRLIEKVCGSAPYLFRPPEGYISDTVIKVADREGYKIVLWNIDTLDWTGNSARDIVRSVIEGARDGAIILCHDSVYGRRASTAEALLKFIPELQKEGYEFVTVGELLSEKR